MGWLGNRLASVEWVKDEKQWVAELQDTLWCSHDLYLALLKALKWKIEQEKL